MQKLNSSDKKKTKPDATSDRGMRWVGTIQLGDNEQELCSRLEQLAADDGVLRFVGEVEIAPSTNQRHVQLCIHFKKPKRRSAVKKFLGGVAHLEQQKGTNAQNHAYCTKDKDTTTWIFETGDWTTEERDRCDIEKARDIILRADGTMKEVWMTVNSHQAYNHARQGLRYRLKRTWRPVVWWFHGPTGSGKTLHAQRLAGDNVWWSQTTGQWWCGYEGEHTIIIDEFRSTFCDFPFLLKLLDAYPMEVPVKGSFVPMVARRIIITSCFAPDEIGFDKLRDSDKISQLQRRIHWTQEFAAGDAGRELAVPGMPDLDAGQSPLVLRSGGAVAPSAPPSPTGGGLAGRGLIGSSYSRRGGFVPPSGDSVIGDVCIGEGVHDPLQGKVQSGSGSDEPPQPVVNTLCKCVDSACRCIAFL